MIEDHYLIVQRWHPNFNPWKADLQCIIVAWVRLPNVTFKFYNVESPCQMGNMIGKMIKVDRSTSIYDKGEFARICVEIDLKKPLLPTYLVFGKERPIVYEELRQVVVQGITVNDEKIPSTGVVGGGGLEKDTGVGVIGGQRKEKSTGITDGTSVVTDGDVFDESRFRKIKILRRDFRGHSSSDILRKDFNGHQLQSVDNKAIEDKWDSRWINLLKEIQTSFNEEKGQLNKAKGPPKTKWVQEPEAQSNNTATGLKGGPLSWIGPGPHVESNGIVSPVPGSSLGLAEEVCVLMEDNTRVHDNGLIQPLNSDVPMCEQDKTLGEVATPHHPPTVSQ
ncbi:hypothetical protein K1719_016540 [Acacia pycnantha]|nr:hypothetical protein K1719_016540 [Acacia pycnantha]